MNLYSFFKPFIPSIMHAPWTLKPSYDCDKNQPVTQNSFKKQVANKRSMMPEINRFWSNSPGAYGGKLASDFGMLSAAQLQHMEHV